MYQSRWNRLLGRGIQEPKEEETSRLSKYDIGVASSLGVMKGIIALFQLYSIVSYIIVEKYDKKRINDYAAFQLTLIPYGLMSVVNILCGLVTPTYSAVYMVNSTIMEEARARGWTFDGTVGELCENRERDSEDGNVGFLATFEGGVESSKDGEKNASVEVNNDQIGEVETNQSPQVNKSETSEVESNTGSEGEITIDCKMVSLDSETSLFHDVWRILKEASRELLFIRLLLIKDQDPGKEYVKFLLESKEGTSMDRTAHIVIPPIGHPTYRKGSWWWFPMLVISDLIVLVSLALPHIITWKLTKFKAPSGGTLYGGVFMAWLVLGQLSPMPGRITWGFVQSLQLKSAHRNKWYASVVFCCIVWSVPALWGFILVGKEKYRHPDGNSPHG